MSKTISSSRKRPRGHRGDRVREVLREQLLAVLELEEAVPAVPREVQQHVRVLVAVEPPVRGRPRRVAPLEHAQHRAHGHLGAAVVDLHRVAVHVARVLLRQKHLSGVPVPRAARHVVRQHQHNVVLGDPQVPQLAVEPQRVRRVPVVEPVPRRVHHHSPVAPLRVGIPFTVCPHFQRCYKQQWEKEKTVK